MSRSQSGSTMTLNTITNNQNHNHNHSSKDDISIYNGDENHKVMILEYNTRVKQVHSQSFQWQIIFFLLLQVFYHLQVWAGSQDNLDGIYDVYSTSTISRPSRPRQISQPVAVPPPPMKEKKKKNKVKSLGGSREDLYNPMMNGRPSSVTGSMVKMRQMPPQMGVPPPQPIYIMAPHPGTLPNPKFFKHHGKNGIDLDLQPTALIVCPLMNITE